MINKLLLIGPNSIHVKNYLDLVKDNFDDFTIISDGLIDGIPLEKQHVLSFQISNPFAILKSTHSLKKIISKFNPTVIHLHNIGSGAWMVNYAVRNLNIRKVATAWGSDVLIGPKRSFIFKYILKLTSKNFHFFTADSEFLASEWKKISNINMKIEVINFGIDDLEKNTSLKENIIYSNRLHNPLYNIDKIINFFIEFKKNKPNSNLKLVIGATGSLSDELKAQANKSNYSKDIEFVGWLDSKTNLAWYQKSRYYISIPKNDGTSVSLLEAMGNGCIPIVSNLPSNLEWIKDGINGVILDSQNPIEKASHLSQNEVNDFNYEIIKNKAFKSTVKQKFLSLYYEKI